MAIDMSTVKEIHYNNKEIIKIEDSSQNVLWQKQTTQPNYLFYMDGTTCYVVDMTNKTSTSITSPFTSGQQGNNVIAFNNKLYWVNGLNQREITISGDTISASEIGTYLNLTNSNSIGNESYKFPNSTDIYFSRTASSGTTYKLDTNNVESTITFTNRVTGNNVANINGTYYGYKYNSHTRYKYSNNDWVSTVSGDFPSVPRNGEWYDVWIANGRIFYDHDSYHYEYNPTTNSWRTHNWKGYTGNFRGARVFTDGTDIYQVGNSGTNTNIFKLDLSTDTWTQYWIFDTAIRGDYFIDKNGSCQLSQNMRPRLNN